MLKIVGGSFGVGGAVYVDYKSKVVRVAAGQGLDRTYERAQVSNVDVSQTEQRKMSTFSVVLGLIVITPLFALFGAFVLGMIGGLVGLIVGVALTMVGSSHSKREAIATFVFVDGKQVRVGGPYTEVNQLAYL